MTWLSILIVDKAWYFLAFFILVTSTQTSSIQA